MTADSPPRIAPGQIRYLARHPTGRLPEQAVRVSEADIRAALPDGRHLKPNLDEIIAEAMLAFANIDRLDAARDANDNLTVQAAVDYRGYCDKVLGLLRTINLYPAAT